MGVQWPSTLPTHVAAGNYKGALVYTSQIEWSTRYGMDDSLYDKCGCGATKLASKEKCTNCWLDSQHYN
ncbi:MAG: hypothetical protein O2866_03080, partial [archaeon]|nr:hypothetical protein [archaeon]